MSDKTSIEWTDATFNPWWGCTKVSPGCDHCYAEGVAQRFSAGIWGAHAERREFGDNHWRRPENWNKRAQREGIRIKVFCASMADVFDNHRVAKHCRPRLFRLIEDTPFLDWQLLTKRIGNVERMVPERWIASEWPRNAWLGATIVNQEEAYRDIPKLLALPAPVRFLSCEPLLGEVDVSEWLFGRAKPCAACPKDIDCECGWRGRHELDGEASLHWVIVGGESGRGARPMHPDWARALRNQCVAAGVPFFFKQWGEWFPDRKGIYHADSAIFGDTAVHRLGKKAAGRLLDGVEHNGMPT